MQMYADYLKEREGFELIWDSQGWASYKIDGEECYIRDIFVKKECRKFGNASALADRVAAMAKSVGAKYLTGTVCPQAKNSTESVQVLIAYGMKLISSTNDKIIFMKEL